MLSYKGLHIEYVDNLPEDSADRCLYPVDGNPVATQMPLARAFEGRLLQERWETHPEAGPPEGLAGDDAPPGCEANATHLRVERRGPRGAAGGCYEVQGGLGLS